jgi:hypothetical protein
MPLGRNPSGVLQRAPREGSRHTGDTGRAAPVVDDIPTDLPGREELTSIPVRIVGTTEEAPERLERWHVASVPLVSTTIPVRAIGEDRQRTKLILQVPPVAPGFSGPNQITVPANGNALVVPQGSTNVQVTNNGTGVLTLGFVSNGVVSLGAGQTYTFPAAYALPGGLTAFNGTGTASAVGVVYGTPVATGALVADDSPALLAGIGWFVPVGTQVEIDAGSSVNAIAVGGPCTLNVLVIDRPD